MINKIIRHMFYQLTRSLRELPVGPHGPNPFRYISCLYGLFTEEVIWFTSLHLQVTYKWLSLNLHVHVNEAKQ